MDFKQIQDLIKLINKSNIGELKIEQGDFKITIKQKEDKYISVASSASADANDACYAGISISRLKHPPPQPKRLPLLLKKKTWLLLKVR